MLAEYTIENTETTVYTVPSNKRAFIFIDIHPLSLGATVTVKVNNKLFFNGYVFNTSTVKLVLTGGDAVKVGTNQTINVFVHGWEE